MLSFSPSPRRSTYLALLLLCLISGLVLVPLASAQAQKSVAEVSLEAGSHDFDHRYRDYDAILKKFVNSNGVDYRSLKAFPEQLHRFLDSAATLSRQEFLRWTENEQLAFLINFYNGATLKLILDHYPVASIKDIGSFIWGPWKQEEFLLFGEKRHLDYIEHTLIRGEYNEPRIHFALVCAAKSCPPLRDEAYIAPSLEDQLNDQGKTFMSNPDKNFFHREKNTLFLSKIFDWYGEDFSRSEEGLIRYLMPYFSTSTQEEIKDPSGVSVAFRDYDWGLNEQYR